MHIITNDATECHLKENQSLSLGLKNWIKDIEVNNYEVRFGNRKLYLKLKIMEKKYSKHYYIDNNYD